MGNHSSRESIQERLLSQETKLQSDFFKVYDVGHYGLPLNCKTMAFCPQQKILAVGTAQGCLKIFGRQGVEVVLQDSGPSISHLAFNARGALVSVSCDSSIGVYNLSSQNHGTLDASYVVFRMK